ncbi:hypothetical protein PIB30_019740 [Stylosanthes scabra]|uniref:Uncharacterized protein n=1 Tax=Stylosanthes scabra TaxID=79078 RepID=A0ABU6W6D1_9FABA|nr:hypothetical protein [Stylosanthes scabra]
MSVRPGKYRKIFGLYEEDHRPFWLNLEGDGRFPQYWSDQAGSEIVPVTYQRLSADQKDTTDILTHLWKWRGMIWLWLVSVGSSISRRLIEKKNSFPSFFSKKRLAGDGSIAAKRRQFSEGGSHEFSTMDHSFDVLGFIEANLGPRAQVALRDYDPIESVRWGQWAMLRSAAILKSVEPHLIIAEEAERRSTKLTKRA